MSSNEALALAGGAATLGWSWATVVADSAVPAWEAAVFEAVNGLPDWPWPLVWLPMQSGSYVGSIVVGGAIAAITRNPRLAATAIGASQTAFWLAKVIKRKANRGRPATLLERVHVREHASGLGYVSGHAAIAFAVATAVAPSLPRRVRPAVLGGATFVALARVYAGVHLPLDSIGGAGFGMLSGTLSRRLAQM